MGDGMVGDMHEQMARPGLGIDTIEPGSSDQRVDRGGALAARYGTPASYLDQGATCPCHHVKFNTVWNS